MTQNYFKETRSVFKFLYRGKFTGMDRLDLKIMEPFARKIKLVYFCEKTRDYIFTVEELTTYLFLTYSFLVHGEFRNAKHNLVHNDPELFQRVLSRLFIEANFQR